MPGRTVTPRAWVAWDGANYTDETARLKSFSGTLRLSAPGSAVVSGRGTADTARVELDNRDRRYSPFNASSPLYASIRDGGAWQRPCYLEMNVGGGYSRLFTGVLRIPNETGLAYESAPTVTLELRSRDELLLNRRMSTPLATFQSLYGATEAEVIARWLTDAGIAGGEQLIDPGLVPLALAWLDDDSPIEDCWQVAAAAGGRFYCDYAGNFCYENAQHWLLGAHATSQETYAPGTHYSGIAIRVADEELFSDVVVEVNQRAVGEPGVLWQPDEPVQVPPSTTRTVTAQFRAPAAEVTGLSYTATTPGGVPLAGVTVTPTYYAQRAELAIANGDATFAATLRGLKIVGRGWVGGRKWEEKAGTALSYWTGRQRRTRRVGGNLAVQSGAQARMLAALVRDWAKLPRWKYVLSGVVGNPARRLGDRITISDPNVLGTGNDREAYITTISFQFSADGGFQFTSLEALDAAAAAIYAPGDYFIVGTHTVNSAQRVYY